MSDRAVRPPRASAKFRFPHASCLSVAFAAAHHLNGLRFYKAGRLLGGLCFCDARRVLCDFCIRHATRLLNGGETDRLNFTAPAKAGEYPFLCTFPGHFIRMYGVMLVVEDLEAWEAKPTVPTDPITGKAFAKQRD